MEQDRTQRETVNETVTKLNGVFEDWVGGDGSLWLFRHAHSLLFLRIGGDDLDNDLCLQVECLGCSYIESPTTWENCHLQIRECLDRDDAVFMVNDDNACVKIACSEVKGRILSAREEYLRVQSLRRQLRG